MMSAKRRSFFFIIFIIQKLPQLVLEIANVTSYSLMIILIQINFNIQAQFCLFENHFLDFIFCFQQGSF